MHCPHDVRKHSTVAYSGIEHSQGRRIGPEVCQFLRRAFSDFPFLIARINESQVLLSIIEEPDWTS
jgi:hypothetical protein